MYCGNCGEKNNDSAKFCKKCGEPLDETPTKNETVKKEKNGLFAAFIIIVIILAIAVIYLSASPQIGDSGLKLEEYDFGNFTMKVPEGATYKEYNSIGKGTRYWAIGYSSDDSDLFMVWIANYKSIPNEYDFIETDGDLDVYKALFNGTYTIQRNIGGYYIDITGTCDLDDLKEMARSITVKNPAESTPTTTTSSSPTPTSSTPSSISILGGSFTTGSADEDKTYARINVGTEHAGENVIVQIFYSRDGNSLNNGNMVPATVHSDGYLEIASAEAYKYYPDYATINIYDSNSKLLTTKSVSLTPTSGTQTF